MEDLLYTPPGSTTAGTSVTFTGSATGTGPFEYEFQVNARAVGSATVVTSPMLPYTLN